jgi:quercetin dioxygenase-like cupin family protein
MIFSKNNSIEKIPVQSVEGKLINGNLLVKPLIKGDDMTLLEVQLQSGDITPFHAHSHESFIYVIKGKLKTIVGGEAYVLGPGDACRHPRKVQHCVEAIEKSTVIEIKSAIVDFT